MDFESYLRSPEALHQTDSAQGALLFPGQILDGMSVVAFLGRGATSEVWRVHDLRQDRDYALKIFAPLPDTPAQAHQRFLTEARALDEFRHPNLMRRYLLQEAGEHPYFTMDVLHPLPEHLPARDILRLLEDVLLGLDALHAKGIIHRDLKPSNILLNDAGQAVLADLGVAHIADADLAKRLGNTSIPNPTLIRKSPFIGTPRYAAPEQLMGEDVSPATDIYALGVVTEQLFGEKVPFLWRPLLRRMTTSRPRFRLHTVRQVRRYVSLIRLFPWLRRILSVVSLIALTGLIWHLAQPTWGELPDSFAEIRHKPTSLVITLDGGHYVQPELCMKPLVGPMPGNTNLMRRLPVYIQGRGTLKCPNITCCEVHLAPGVTFMTSGRFKANESTFIKDTIPPPDANWNNHIGYPTYVVEPGARLVFTENDAYPAALIRRP